MGITIKNIIPAKFAEASQTTQYTATNCKAIIDKFLATNNGATTETISLNIVVSGETAAVSNRVVNAKQLTSGESYTFPEVVGSVLESDSFISSIASTISAITIAASGREIT